MIYVIRFSGGLFAISAKFFWELGGYDTGVSRRNVEKFLN
jgi:hypothetical protein